MVKTTLYMMQDLFKSKLEILLPGCNIEARVVLLCLYLDLVVWNIWTIIVHDCLGLAKQWIVLVILNHFTCACPIKSGLVNAWLCFGNKPWDEFIEFNSGSVSEVGSTSQTNYPTLWPPFFKVCFRLNISQSKHI